MILIIILMGVLAYFSLKNNEPDSLTGIGEGYEESWD